MQRVRGREATRTDSVPRNDIIWFSGPRLAGCATSPSVPRYQFGSPGAVLFPCEQGRVNPAELGHCQFQVVSFFSSPCDAPEEHAMRVHCMGIKCDNIQVLRKMCTAPDWLHINCSTTMVTFT